MYCWHPLRFIGLALLVVSAGTSQKAELTSVSIVNLRTSPGESVVSFEVDAAAGMVQSVQNLPIGWYLTIDNDASWRAKIKANTTVGAASITPEELGKIRFVIKKHELYLKFALTGVVSLTKDYERERTIQLNLRDFAITSGE